MGTGESKEEKINDDLVLVDDDGEADESVSEGISI